MRFPLLARFFIALCLFFAVEARAQAPSQIENSRPMRLAWVSDKAGVLSPSEERRINAVCVELNNRGEAQLAVMTVKSLNGRSVKDYANDSFRSLKIGKSSSDNGILLLNAVDDRRVRMEVGYGLEDKLPDGKTAEIQRTQIAPFVANGEYGAGLYAGVLATAQAIDPSFTAPVEGSSTSPSASQPELERRGGPSNSDFPVTVYPAGGGLIFALGGLLILLFPLLMIGGLVWFFTAAMRRPLRCSKCRAPVQQLSDTAELPSLSPVQQFEQQIGARDYRVWHCQQCHN